MPEYVQVLTTTDTKGQASELAKSVVGLRLAACAQVLGPIESTYWWEGKVETAAEWQILMKTTVDRYQALAEHLAGIHSYDTPEIIATPIVSGDATYLAWITAETSPVP